MCCRKLFRETDGHSIPRTQLRTPYNRCRSLRRCTCRQDPLVAYHGRALAPGARRFPESAWFADYSYLLDFYQEALVFRRVSIWIDCGRRQLVSRIQRRFAFILLDASISPMNRYSNLECLFAIDYYWFDSLRDQRLRYVLSPRATDFHLFTASQS